MDQMNRKMLSFSWNRKLFILEVAQESALDVVCPKAYANSLELCYHYNISPQVQQIVSSASHIGAYNCSKLFHMLILVYVAVSKYRHTSVPYIIEVFCHIKIYIVFSETEKTVLNYLSNALKFTVTGHVVTKFQKNYALKIFLKFS